MPPSPMLRCANNYDRAPTHQVKRPACCTGPGCAIRIWPNAPLASRCVKVIDRLPGEHSCVCGVGGTRPRLGRLARVTMTRPGCGNRPFGATGPHG